MCTPALGTAKPARNSQFQALLQIRGKILNNGSKIIGLDGFRESPKSDPSWTW